MKCLKPLLPLLLIGVASPAMAQVSMSLLPGDLSSESSMLELSVEEPSSSEAPSSMSAPPVFSMSVEEPSTSSSFIRMSVPPMVSSMEPPAPVTSAEAFQSFFDACTAISGGDPEGYDKANDAGWVPYEGADYGPFKQVYTGSRDFEGYGAIEIWASLETYPTQRLGYCRIDFGDYNNTFDFTQVAGIGGLAGTVGEGGANGVWESADKKLLVIGARYDGTLSFEFNVLVGDTPAP